MWQYSPCKGYVLGAATVLLAHNLTALLCRRSAGCSWRLAGRSGLELGNIQSLLADQRGQVGGYPDQRTVRARQHLFRSRPAAAVDLRHHLLPQTVAAACMLCYGTAARGLLVLLAAMQLFNISRVGEAVMSDIHPLVAPIIQGIPRIMHDPWVTEDGHACGCGYMPSQGLRP